MYKIHVQMQTVELDVGASQAVIHALVSSLYSADLTIDASNFEEMLRVAHFLQVRGFREACRYLKKDQRRLVMLKVTYSKFLTEKADLGTFAHHIANPALWLVLA